MKKLIKSILSLVFLISCILTTTQVYAQEQQPLNKYAIYFAGIGCPHCARVSPVLNKKINEGGLVVIEYEIYKNLGNAQVLNEYADSYNLDLGIPQLFFSNDIKESGDTSILNKLDQMITDSLADTIYLPDGTNIAFANLDLNTLERYPFIYSENRIAIRKSLKEISDTENEMIKQFISASTVKDAIANLDGKTVKPEKVGYSGGSLHYENAIEISGWLLQWNGETKQVNSNESENEEKSISSTTTGISVGKTIALGLADSVNPCAISVLALMLIAIVTYNPRDRKKVLLSGLSFVLAVIIMYLVYGYLIITAFQFIQSISSIKLYIYKALGVGAIILGSLELKDFFKYKPGGVATEMPLFFRPKVNKLISKVTSPLGAFTVGLFVTLFLLPCTIGPYIILGGLLADQGFINAIPNLLLYNFVFVLPMIVVTLIVFFGSKRAEDVKDWKEKNVRQMHLIAGVLMLLIGILMTLGIF